MVMNSKLIEMQFFETYYYANIVNNIIDNPYSYIRKLNDLWDGYEAEFFLPNFPKWSRLHSLIYHVIDSIVDEESLNTTVDKVQANSEYKLWIDKALEFHNIENNGFKSWLSNKGIRIDKLSENDVYDYYEDLHDKEIYQKLVRHISSEVFFIFFANRKLLAAFNEFMAGVMISDDDELYEENKSFFEKPGKLKRVNIPQWAKRAVFYRDRGMCSFCFSDLSGLITTQPNKHYDHIVPLAKGGLNDITNLQLLCGECNLQKGSSLKSIINYYEGWY